jgi:integrase
VPKIALTDLAIKALKPATQTDYWDTGLANFGMRAGPRRKTFIALVGPKRRRVTIGHYPEWSLHNARRKAMLILGSPQSQLSSTMPYPEAIDLFLSHQSKNNRPSTLYQTERLLRRHFPFTGSLATATRQRIMDIIAELPRSEANHAFVAMRTFLNWCVAKQFIQYSPLMGLKLPYKTFSRDRALEDHELATILKAITPPTTRYDVLIGLLITTGQRCNEIASLRPEFINREAQTITLPAWLTKNNTQHTFPYGPLTAALLEQLEFKEKPTDSWGTIKRLFDKRVVLPHYTWHDFRRTLSTIMSRENLAPITAVEALLNHKTGSRSPIQRVYDRHDYMPQMRAAVMAYDAYLTRLMSP